MDDLKKKAERHRKIMDLLRREDERKRKEFETFWHSWCETSLKILDNEAEKVLDVSNFRIREAESTIKCENDMKSIFRKSGAYKGAAGPRPFAYESAECEVPLLAMAESFTSSDGLFVKDSSFTYRWVNEQMGRLTRVPNDLLIGMTDDKLYDEHTTKFLNEVCTRCFREGKSQLLQFTRIMEGVPRVFLEALIPRKNKSGSVERICGVIRDVTAFYAPNTEATEELAEYPSFNVLTAFEEKCQSPAMRETLRMCREASSFDTTVLLTGESGSGKDFLARYLHYRSDRGDCSFESLNCAALSSDLVEAELFGWEPGAHSTAHARKLGLLEIAHGGTLFLNEIGELPIKIQPKFLEFLEYNSFRRLGGLEKIKVNTRIIAATNRILDEDVKNGLFRLDLFQRLKEFPIKVPPLRDRLEDLPILIELLESRITKKFRLCQLPTIDEEMMTIFRSYSWPGNVRELKGVLTRLATGGRESLRDLEIDLDGTVESESTDCWSWSTQFPKNGSLSQVVHDLKTSLIGEALRRVGGDKQKAARLIGTSRDSIYKFGPKDSVEKNDKSD